MKYRQTTKFDRATMQRRSPTQFVTAEGLWHDPASAGIRKEFHLPPGGPFTG